MGATESKLTFRKGVFRLFEERVGTSERLCTSFLFQIFNPYFIMVQNIRASDEYWSQVIYL